MAMIECSECGSEVSDKADECPNCGNPDLTTADKINRWGKQMMRAGCGFTLLVIILFIIILIFAGSW